MASDPLRPTPDRIALRRVVRAAAVALVAWLIVGFGIVPTLIRRAYAGEGPAFLNALITGQADHPVGFYLEAGRALALRGMLALSVLGLAVLLVVRFRHRLVRAGRRFETPAVPTASALQVAFAMGAVAGALEAVTIFARQFLAGMPPPDYHPGGGIWLAPLVSGAAALLFFLPWAVWRGRTAGGVGLRLPIIVLGALGLLAVLDIARLGFHPVSQLLMAVGAASVVGRIAAARPQRFVVGARRLAWALPALALAVGAGERVWSAAAERTAVVGLAPAPTDAPNVLIVLWDAVRARNLGLYGYARATSPRLDELADRGVTFERAMAPSSWSLPSHGTLFTGRHPHRLGVTWTDVLDDRWPTLAEVLTTRGYETAGFSGNRFYASRASGVARGFAHYRDMRLSPISIAHTSWLVRTPSRYLLDRLGDHRDLTQWEADDINASLLAWLDARGEPDRPFFAFLNYFDAHDPYRPPAPFDTLFVDPDTRYWVDYDLTSEELSELEDAYDGSIAYVDHALGELVTELEERGLFDHTLLIVTSDHGEQFGEIGPGALTHGYGLYEWLLHVPLVMVYPDQLPRSVRVPAPVGLRDVPATVLDLIGGDGPSLPGTSLHGLWEGRETRPSPALSWTTPGEWSPTGAPVAKGPMFSVREGDLHYILEGDGAEHLYDVARDPWEQEDLGSDPAYAAPLEALRATVRRLATEG